MNTLYNAYKAHDLSINMRTSSGDEIAFDFSNSKNISFNHNEKKGQDTLNFSSMQTFKFSIKSNGISKQDQKEIDEFMKTAQPLIDNFLKELEQDAPKTPVTKLARKIASIFEPNKDKETQSYKKSSIVHTFDNSIQKIDKSNLIDKIFEDAKKLLTQTLKEFDNFNKSIYA